MWVKPILKTSTVAELYQFEAFAKMKSNVGRRYNNEVYSSGTGAKSPEVALALVYTGTTE